jgi:putative DNA primase/helicase
MAAPADQWDRDVWSLNTPAGVINLCDGRIREALPTDFMTKSTSVAPGGTCPRFLQFIHEIFDGNEELVTFFQRVFGLCLTGVTRDHAVFFGYGSGGNGKSLLMRIMGEILGDYHAVSSVEAFSVSKHDRHLTEIARLRGARLVIVSETESGRQWAEARVKELTGGTPVAANFMRQDQFEFVPQFKLFVTGNNKPNLAAATESMRRRFNLIPFNVTFSGPRRDNLLYDKLVEELPGILAWAIEGCAQWQLCGLMPPAAVSEATDEYFLSQDIFGVWLSTMCEQHPLCGESARSLFASYKAFCKLQVGETPHGEKQFAQELARRGFAKKRTNSGIVYVGIRLAEQHAETPGGLCQNETDGGGDVC